MSFKERFLGLIGTKGVVESTACLGETDSQLKIRTHGGLIEVITRDDLITDQGIPDGVEVVVIKFPGLKPRVVRMK